jgi:hypothetical protein
VPAPPSSPQAVWAASIEPLPEGGWLYVTTLAGQEGMLFASTHNVMRSGTEVTLWIRWEYQLPLSVPLKDVPFPVKDILKRK